jgi:hypothetical protein
MKEILLKKEIQKISGDLVRNAEELADNYLDKDLKENQIRNVINVASSAGSVLEVINFIKYQIGRCSPNKEWRYKKGAGEETFGKRLIHELTKLKEEAEKIVKRLNKNGFSEMVEEVWLKLTELYLGYLNRYFKYLKES